MVPMRASRLLRMLLLLQNRGRLTSAQLARELEVARRTVLRDVDALTEAGVPIIVYQGNQGGIELGFNYRSRLTGLDADEAEAVAVLLTLPASELHELGLSAASERAHSKLIELFPGGVRDRIMLAQSWLRFDPQEEAEPDARIAALAGAIRRRAVVRIRARSASPRAIHPVRLVKRGRTWSVVDANDPAHPIPLAECGEINIPAVTF